MAEDKMNRSEKRNLSKMRIVTAIAMGKNRNKEIAKFLDTDKSFAAKKVKELEQEGLVVKEGEGKNTKYRVNEFNVLSFLKSTVIITRGEKNAETEEERNENEERDEEESE